MSADVAPGSGDEHERPARPRRRFWYTVLILATGLLWIFRPHWPADPANVHPDILALKTPLRSVRWTMIMDGGTKVIAIRDADDTRFYAVLPTPNDESTSYRKDVFLGAPYYTDAGASKVVGYSHTRRALLRLIADHRPRKEVSDLAIFSLSQRISDLLRLKYRQQVPPHADYLAIPDHLEDFDVDYKTPATPSGVP